MPHRMSVWNVLSVWHTPTLQEIFLEPPKFSQSQGEFCRGNPMTFAKNPITVERILVPRAGLEPACGCPRWILSPLRLPFRHLGFSNQINDLYRRDLSL